MSRTDRRAYCPVMSSFYYRSKKRSFPEKNIIHKDCKVSTHTIGPSANWEQPWLPDCGFSALAVHETKWQPPFSNAEIGWFASVLGTIYYLVLLNNFIPK
jgi:hypothetical protein